MLSPDTSSKVKKPAFKVGYMRDTSDKDRAIDTIVEGLRAEYDAKKLPMPNEAKLRKMAAERYESSLANLKDGHLGTAAKRE